MQFLAGRYLGVWSLVIDQLAKLRNRLLNWCIPRWNVLFPLPVIVLFKVSVYNIDFYYYFKHEFL
jgi:hypothetical protein